MNIRDRIGKRGEAIFTTLITKWCDERQWFEPHFLGDKAETKDFYVTLIEPTSKEATCNVQVKSTNLGYVGTGDKRKLRVGLSKKSMKELQECHSPTYVVGIDIHGGCGYVFPITATMTRGFSSLPTTFPLDCRTIKAIWKEVDDFWSGKETGLATSRLS